MSGRELPSTWAWSEFGDIAKVASNLVDPQLTPDAQHVAPNHISSWTGRLIEKSTVRTDGVTSPKHRFHPGQIIYSKIRPYLAKAILADFDGLCSADMYPIDSEIDAHFLLRWILSKDFTEIAALSQGRTVLPKINQEALQKIPVPVPPLPEQRRIVEKIEALTTRSRRACEALDTLPALIDRYRQSLLAAAFRGDLTAEWRQNHGVGPGVKEIRESLLAQANILVSEKRRPRKRLETALVDDRPSINLGECPSSWAVMKMEEVTDPTRLIQYGILMPGPDVAEGVPYVKVMNIRNDIINVGDLRRTTRDIHKEFMRSELKENDVLLTIRGTFGRVALVPSELEGGNITQDTARVAPLTGIVPAYIANYLRSPLVQQYLAKVAKGVAVRGVNIGDLRPMPVPVPPYEEQLEICRELAKALEAVKRLERYVASTASRCSTLDQSILAKAFRGELVPQDPNDEPASVLLERIRAERAAAGPAPRRGRRPKAVGGG